MDRSRSKTSEMSVVADKVQVEEIVVAEIAEDRSEPIAYKSVVHEISEPEIQLVATNEKIATELKDRLEHSNTYTEANSISAIENEINAEEILAPISSAQVLSELVVPEQVRLTQPIEVLLNLDVQKGLAPGVNITTAEKTDSEEQVNAEIETTEFMVPTRPESDVIIELQEQGEEIEILLRGDIIEPSLEDVYAPIEIAAEVNPEAPDNEFETIEVGISAEIVELRTEILGISADLALSTETFTYKGSEVYENNAVAEFIASVETQPEDVSTIEFHEITSNHNEPAQTVEKLAKYFIQEAKEAEPHIHEIVTILNDIEESLPDDNVEFTLDEVLNEVVVQKLVELFTELGHEKPLQAVKEYFEDYGIAEGLSILNYVANLARSFDAQEVSPVSKHVKDDINALIFALGSVLLRLTTNKTLESSV